MPFMPSIPSIERAGRCLLSDEPEPGAVVQGWRACRQSPGKMGKVSDPPKASPADDHADQHGTGIHELCDLGPHLLCTSVS